MEEDYNQLKITCKIHIGFVTCSGRSGELIYITFLHYGMSTLGLYTEELVSENFYFQWPSRTKMQHLYQNILKESNGDHKYLRCPDIRDNNFEVMRPAITLDKVDQNCAETVEKKLPEMIQVLLPTQT